MIQFSDLQKMKLKPYLPFICLFFFTLLHAHGADWVTDYYLDPKPDEFAKNVQELENQGIFEKENAQWPVVSFLSQVMAANPSQVGEWMAFSETLNEPSIGALRLAAWYSHTSTAKKYFHSKELTNYIQNEAPNILELEVNNPTVLDMLWGYFFATGEIEPLERISKALELSKYTDAVDSYKESQKTEEDKKNLYLGVTFQSAMWSIESNCKNHPLVLEHFRSIFQAPKTPKSQSLWIGVILSKVVPNEIGISIGNKKEIQSGDGQ